MNITSELFYEAEYILHLGALSVVWWCAISRGQTDGWLISLLVFDVWNATWSSSSTRPPPAGPYWLIAAAYVYSWGKPEGPVMTCGAAPTWRHSSAAGRGLKVGTHGLQIPPPHPGAVGSSIGGAGRTRNRPGCCLDPECPDLKKEEWISQHASSQRCS